MEDDEFTAFEEQAIVYLGNITRSPKVKSPLIGLIPLDIKDGNAFASSAPAENGITKYANYFVGDGVGIESDEPAAIVGVDLAEEGSS